MQQSSVAEISKPSKKKRPTAEQIQQSIERRNVELARAKVLHEMNTAQNPRYQELLKAELAVLEKRLSTFE